MEIDLKDVEKLVGFDREYYAVAHPELKEFSGPLFIYYTFKGIGYDHWPFEPYEEWNWQHPLVEMINMNPEYYLDNYPDVQAAKVDPVVHFLVWGWREGRFPFEEKYVSKIEPFMSVARHETKEEICIDEIGTAESLRIIEMLSEEQANRLLSVCVKERPKYLYRSPLAILMSRLAAVAHKEFLSDYFMGAYFVGQPLVPRSITRLSSWERMFFRVTDVESACRRHNWRIDFLEPQPEQVVHPVSYLGEGPILLGEKKIEMPRPYVAVLEDVEVIIGASMIFDHDNQMLDDHLSFYWDVEQNNIRNPAVTHYWREPVSKGSDKQVGRALVVKQATKQSIERAISLTGPHANNYFHWLTEIGPKLEYIEDNPEFQDWPILSETTLPPQLKDCLARLKNESQPVIELDPGDCVKIGQLVHIPDVSIFRFRPNLPGRPSDHVVSKASLAYLRRKLASGVTPGEKNSHIYVRRSSNALFRYIVNAQALEDKLSRLGFQPVEPAHMSLDEQISVFCGAELIVAEAGATMANLVFCSPRTKIVCLTPNSTRTNTYWLSQLVESMDLELLYYRGREIRRTHRIEIQNNYLIPISHFTELLVEQMEKWGIMAS